MYISFSSNQFYLIENITEVSCSQTLYKTYCLESIFTFESTLKSWKAEFHQLFRDKFSLQSSHFKLSYSRFTSSSSSEKNLKNLGFHTQHTRPLLAFHFWCYFMMSLQVIRYLWCFPLANLSRASFARFLSLNNVIHLGLKYFV